MRNLSLTLFALSLVAAPAQACCGGGAVIVLFLLPFVALFCGLVLAFVWWWGGRTAQVIRCRLDYPAERYPFFLSKVFGMSGYLYVLFNGQLGVAMQQLPVPWYLSLPVVTVVATSVFASIPGAVLACVARR